MTMMKQTTEEPYLVPVGRFRGRPITEVPDSYLETCAGSSMTRQPFRGAVLRELARRGLTGPLRREPLSDPVRAQLDLTISTTFAVLERLEDVETCRGGWRARCPVHDDAERALTVGLSPYAFACVGLTCAAGCDPARVYAILGLPPPQEWVM